MRPDDLIRKERLRAWIDEHGLNQAELAARLGVDRSYVTLLLRPDRYFGKRAGASIETKLGMPAGHLTNPGDDDAPVAEWSDPMRLAQDAYALVPYVVLSIKEGEIDSEVAALPAIALPAATLAARGVKSRDDLRIVRAPDRSMEPGLLATDIVMVDTAQTDPEDGQVYALRAGGRIVLRRLFLRADGSIRLHPDNPAFPDEDVRPGDGFDVLGRQVWRGG